MKQQRKTLPMAICAGALVIGLTSATASANECTDTLKDCLDKNRAEYEACTQRAHNVSRGEADPAASYGKLRATCHKYRQELDQVCRDAANKCSRKRMKELKELSGQ